jgi:nucleoside-diphosphate-sugar epimerase
MFRQPDLCHAAWMSFEKQVAKVLAERSVNGEDAPLVVVTGAAGFIALHCIQQLLELGFRVRGTLRRMDQEIILRKDLGLSPEVDARLSFTDVDLLRDEGWEQAMRGADYLLHTASPLPKKIPKNEDELIVPAREGALRALRAAVAANVTRVVMTSSIAAIVEGNERSSTHVFDETEWSDPSQPIPAYYKSKTLAERAAWTFGSEHPELELVMLNPGFVLGPTLSAQSNTSNEGVRKLIDREVPGAARLMFPMVDVRDVARAHLLAMLSPEAPGERFILSHEEHWFVDLCKILKGAGYPVSTRIFPDFVVHLVGLFDPTVRLVAGDLGRELRVSSEKARRLLGWETRRFEETVLDTAASIMAWRKA